MLKRLCLLALCSVAVAACDIGEVTKIHEIAWRDAADAPASWKEVLGTPVDLDVTAYVTGEVRAGPGILIDPDVAGVPEIYQQDIWVPALSYRVEHPSGRSLVLDAGLRAGDCSYAVLVVIGIECRNQAGQDAVTRLAADGVGQVDYLLISHFHGDHASNLPAMIAAYDPVVLTTEAELAAVESSLRETSGYKRDHLRADMRVETADAGFIDMPLLGKSADLFGDGSVWLISTPGHTPGHLSVLLNSTGGPMLLTFDAAHLAATYSFNAPGSLSYDVDLANESIDRLKAFATSYPQTEVLFGHEPKQWADRGTPIKLAASRDVVGAAHQEGRD